MSTTTNIDYDDFVHRISIRIDTVEDLDDFRRFLSTFEHAPPDRFCLNFNYGSKRILNRINSIIERGSKNLKEDIRICLSESYDGLEMRSYYESSTTLQAELYNYISS